MQIIKKIQKDQQNQSPLRTNEFYIKNWDYAYNPPKFVKTTLQIVYTNDFQIQYIENESIVRIDDINETSQNPEVLTNLEQIKHLKFLGEYGHYKQKIGFWKVIWKGEILKDISGQYSNDGKKFGQWKEIIKNYNSYSQVYEVGKYFNDKRIGLWKYIYGEKEIGGGEYDQESQKNGKWVELSDGFWDRSQITYNGEYKDGKKVGIWDICLIEPGIFFGFNYKKIGGGKYGDSKQEDLDVKVGKWIELIEGFQSNSQITYIGYYGNGKKVGRWDILHRGQKIGGGSYIDEAQGDSYKFGQWTELSEGFQDYSQVTFIGEYVKGIKVGQWNIQYVTGEQIGGGSYDDVAKEASIKIGKWIELSDDFAFYSWVTYNGEYKQGRKVARWEISYEGKQIGGGSYDDSVEGDAVKIGKWVELSDWFFVDSQVIYEGQYVNGKKLVSGIFCIGRKKREILQKCIFGGGLYDYQESRSSMKSGKWIELIDGFNLGQQVICTGEYKNGTKVDEWVTINIGKHEKLQELRYDK